MVIKNPRNFIFLRAGYSGKIKSIREFSRERVAINCWKPDILAFRHCLDSLQHRSRQNLEQLHETKEKEQTLSIDHLRSIHFTCQFFKHIYIHIIVTSTKLLDKSSREDVPSLGEPNENPIEEGTKKSLKRNHAKPQAFQDIENIYIYICDL